MEGSVYMTGVQFMCWVEVEIVQCHTAMVNGP